MLYHMILRYDRIACRSHSTSLLHVRKIQRDLSILDTLTHVLLTHIHTTVHHHPDYHTMWSYFGFVVWRTFRRLAHS
jgi:hypothetical protein